MKVSFSSGERRYMKPNVYNFVITEITPNNNGKFGSKGWQFLVACLDDKPVYDITGKTVLEGQSTFDMKIRTTFWYKGTEEEPTFNTNIENSLKAICSGSGIPFTDDGEIGIDSIPELVGCIFRAMASPEVSKKDGNTYNNINPETIMEADAETERLADEYQSYINQEADNKKASLTTKNLNSSVVNTVTTAKAVQTGTNRRSAVVSKAEPEAEAPVEQEVQATTAVKRDRRAIFAKK